MPPGRAGFASSADLGDVPEGVFEPDDEVIPDAPRAGRIPRHALARMARCCTLSAGQQHVRLVGGLPEPGQGQVRYCSHRPLVVRVNGARPQRGIFPAGVASGPHPMLAEPRGYRHPGLQCGRHHRSVDTKTGQRFAQTYSPERIIVVDDGSSDTTARLASALEPRVTVVRQPNGGQGSARNRVVALIDSPLTLFLDSDY